MKNNIALLAIVFFSVFKTGAQTKSVSHEDSAFKNAIPNVVYYYSDTLKLKAYLQRPEGKGPFPVYMWNHDSERDPDFNLKLAYYWTKKGFVFFMPIRRGQSDNPGLYLVDQEKVIRRRRGEMAQLQFRQIYALHKKYNEDVIAALKWVKQQPYADTNKIVVAGAGYGGIQTLITAEKDGQSRLGVKCFIAFSPAAEMWDKMWGDSLVYAAGIAKRPIFLMQAHNDYNLGPCEIVGPVLEEKGKPNRSEIFPVHGTPTDHEDGYTAFFADPDAWGKEVLKYLKDCGVKGKRE